MALASFSNPHPSNFFLETFPEKRTIKNTNSKAFFLRRPLLSAQLRVVAACPQPANTLPHLQHFYPAACTLPAAAGGSSALTLSSVACPPDLSGIGGNLGTTIPIEFHKKRKKKLGHLCSAGWTQAAERK